MTDDLIKRLRDRGVCSPAQNSCRNDLACEQAADRLKELQFENFSLRTRGLMERERIDFLERSLGNLLAIIHRDGGHHTGRVGYRQSVDDAHKIWAGLMTRIEALERELAEARDPALRALNGDFDVERGEYYSRGRREALEEAERLAVEKAEKYRASYKDVRSVHAGSSHVEGLSDGWFECADVVRALKDPK
jgi:hypothetical protein